MDRIQSRISEHIRQIYSNLVWTHKIHEKQAEIYEWRVISFKTLIILTTLLVVIVLSMPDKLIFGSHEIDLKCIEIILALIDLFLILYEWGFKPEAKLQLHRITAKQLLPYRNRFSLLLSDKKNNLISDENFMEVRDEIIGKVDEIYMLAPQTSKKAVKLAEKEVMGYLKQVEI